MVTDKFFNVVCISNVYDEYANFLDIYSIGETYKACEYYDKVILGENNYIEYDWIVYSSDHNHYQFIDKDFHKYFIDVIKQREDKLNSILDINI